MEWKDITVGQYERIREVLANSDDEIGKYVSILSIVTGHSEDYYYNMPTMQVMEEFKILDFLKTEVKNDVAFKFKLGNTKYEVLTNASKMTLGRYIDFTSILKNPDHKIAELMMPIFIPAGVKDEDIDAEKVISDINNYLPITNAVGLGFFFQMTLKILTKTTIQYSLRKLRKELKKEKSPEKIEVLQKSISLIQTQQIG